MKTQDTQDTQERDGLGKYSSRNEAGYVSLAYAIVEEAVTDYKELQGLGIIKQGRAAWPTSGEHKVLGYTSGAQVQHLIHFFKGGDAARMLDLINSPIDSGAMLGALGFTN
jgi:hypothetical protein